MLRAAAPAPLSVRALAATALLALPLLAGCQREPQAAAVTAAEAVRQPDGSYHVTWTVQPAGVPVDVLVGDRPDAGPAAMRRVSAADTDGSTDVAVDPAQGRPYFLVQPQKGTGMHTAERVLPLEGGRNFRDLGGYATADGRHVRWGRLYRSGVMAGLTDRDFGYLSGLGIRTICDFRAVEERQSEPTNWRAGMVDYIAWDGEQKLAGMNGLFAAGLPSADQVRATMTALYGTLPDAFAPQYTVMFQRLTAGAVPLAFNCSAGKDRTGVAAALILTALGVPRDTVLADYALSDKVVDYEKAFATPVSAELAAKNPTMGALARLPAEVRAPLLKSDPAYLDAALAAIEARHGSVEAYLKAELGLSDQDIQSLRASLLE
jgi:protein-tyrosine phosphatase